MKFKILLLDYIIYDPTTLDLQTRENIYPKGKKWKSHKFGSINVDITTSVQKDHVLDQLGERSSISIEEFEQKLMMGLELVMQAVEGFLKVEEKNKKDYDIQQEELKGSPKIRGKKAKKLANRKTLPKIKFEDQLNQYMILMTKSRIKVPILYRKKTGIIYVSTVLKIDYDEQKSKKRFALGENSGKKYYLIKLDI